jgi:uncharacterized protein
MNNPFQYGRILNSRELVNRTAELQEIRETIASGGKLFIIGPRRFGKTSLLNAVEEERLKKGDIILNYNAEAFPDIELLITKLIEDSAALLKGDNQQRVDKLKNYFKSLRPEFSLSFAPNEWKAALGVNVVAQAKNQTALLVDALDGLERLAADQSENVKTALIIDEFQEIVAGEAQQAEKQIRAAIQKHRHTAYIFAGSATHMLREMVLDHKRPFYRLGKILDIDKIPRPEFAKFLVDKFTYGDFFTPKSSSEDKRNLALLILDTAEDVPYNVQMLAHNLWNNLVQIKIGSPEKAFLDKNLIEETLHNVVSRQDATYTQSWNSLTANQKKALAAVVTENGEGLRSKEVTRRTKMSASAIQRALESLTKQNILREKGKGGNISFHFEDPFFAHWIRLFTFLDS